MDDFVKWLKSNLKEVIFICVGIVIFSILVGLTIGLIKRSRSFEKRFERIYAEKLYNELKNIKNLENKKIEDEKKSISKLLLIPPEVKINPIIPQLEKYEEFREFIKGIKLSPITIQDLINSRTSNGDAPVKAVRVSEREVGIITINKEKAEP